MSKPTASIADLIASASTDEIEDATEAVPVAVEDAETACPECGITFKEFQATGRFGCPNDYAVFAEELSPLVRRAHGTQRHIGRTPPGTGRGELLARELAIVREELKRFIADEAYEQAAAARDRIARLEEAIATPGAGAAV
jgi:protein arginine kinase activator